ncbi:hypothetical protein EXU57_13660 [Segetibacter sp. 3557_3]|nr:glycosyl hydrolase family 28-related protein [Segetibacter sp. 3557_3]TDH25151.1 hypothetical protein EXU57_13660 [Segetibacter sp. 3557_3]
MSSYLRPWPLFILSLLTLLVCSLTQAVAQTGHPTSDDEFVGPFASWINVKTQFGAAGDGVADDTEELQAAFDAVGNADSKASVVYLPPGTYRISAKLAMNYKMNVSVIGADPANTTIKWAGASGGTMMFISGTAYSRFNRITWDGSALASIAIDQSYNGSQGYFDTGNEYADDIIKDVATGIRGGFLGHGFAETAIMRCRFIRNTSAGISLGNFNALDAWVWSSVFQDCNIGITNIFGAGNFQVYNSVFKNSTTSDISIDNTGLFAFRDNTSINSRAFITTTLKRYPALITIQGNKILDPVLTAAINIRNHGPVALFDNVIRSRAGATGSVVIVASDPSSELFCMGNTYTVTNAVQSSSRKILFDKPVVPRESLLNLIEPVLPGTQPSLNRQVFEVPAGANAAMIQEVINQAALVSGKRPVVHFAHGNYQVAKTLVVPAGSDMQLTGDGHGDFRPTWLTWTGSSPAPVIDIMGPSKVTVRDLSVNGNNLAVNIRINNVDQVGSRFFMHQVELHLNKSNLLVNGLDHTLVLAQNSRYSQSTAKSLSVVGGPISAAGNPHAGRTVLYAGLGFDNQLTYEVLNGANLLTRDVWYESWMNTTYLKLTGAGTFVSEGCRLASPSGTAVPIMNVKDFSGKATFMNLHLDDRIAISGNGGNSSILGLGVLSKGSTYVENTTSPAADVRLLNGRIVQDPNTVFPRSGSRAATNSGIADSTFIAGMLQDTRTLHAEILTALPGNVSDVRFYRVWCSGAEQGVEINAAANPVYDDAALLTSLRLNEASLSPLFQQNRFEYSATVGQHVNSVTLVAGSGNNNAIITINDVVTANGAASAPISLAPGLTPVVVKVSVGDVQNTYIINITRASGISLAAKVFLQGAYNLSTGRMNNGLNTLGILQSKAPAQPYQLSPFNYAGAESVPTDFFYQHTSIVDWLLVELRDQNAPATVVASRAVFLHQDGTITDTNGVSSNVVFPGVSPGSYYVTIKHRNHLSVRSATPVDFGQGQGSIDFSLLGSCFQNQPYSSNVKWGSVYCMRAGNANANTNVRFTGPANDQDQIQNNALGGSLSLVLTNHYAREDLNLDGSVKSNGPVNDQSFLLNIIMGGFIGTMYIEQL